MAERSLIPDDLLRQLIGVGQVDILVGVSTLNHGDAAVDLVRAVRACLRTYYPRHRAALLNIDRGSSDGSSAAILQSWRDGSGTVRAQGLRTTPYVTTTVSEVPEDDGVTRSILAATDLLQAGIVVVLDADAAGPMPEWIAALSAPVRDGQADLVAPVFARPAAQGLLVTQLMRPLVRAIYGRRLHEPLLPEFACSGRLAAHCTQLDWSAAQLLRNSHFWIAAEALAGPFAVRQCVLGRRPLVPGRVMPALPDLFKQVVGSAFASIDLQADAWLARTGSDEIPTTGAWPAEEVTREPGQDGASLLASFADDVRNLHEILARILNPSTLDAIAAASAAEAGPAYPDELWAATVAEFLMAFHHSVMRRDHITQALLPLYMARTGSFLQNHANSEPAAVEAAIESLGARFEDVKPWIVERWSSQHEVAHG